MLKRSKKNIALLLLKVQYSTHFQIFICNQSCGATMNHYLSKKKNFSKQHIQPSFNSLPQNRSFLSCCWSWSVVEPSTFWEGKDNKAATRRSYPGILQDPPNEVSEVGTDTWLGVVPLTWERSQQEEPGVLANTFSKLEEANAINEGLSHRWGGHWQ